MSKVKSVMSTCNVFTYGTLMLPEVMEAVSGHQFRSEKAELSDYQRFQIKKKVYPAIVYSKNQSTNGVVYFDVDADSLERLDYFEDVIYHRNEVTVILQDGNTISAYAYIVNPEFESTLSDKPWILDDFKDKCLEQYVTNTQRWMQDYNA